jgi:hypothetical protein
LPFIDYLLSLSHVFSFAASEEMMRPPMFSSSNLRGGWLDAAGITVSVVCAIHCAASAISLTALTLLGVTRAMPDWLEWAFLTASLVIGFIALRNGHRVHLQSRPLRLFGLGIGALVLARLTGWESPIEVAAVVMGATALVAAHALNWYHSRRCTKCALGDEAPKHADFAVVGAA